MEVAAEQEGLSRIRRRRLALGVTLLALPLLLLWLSSAPVGEPARQQILLVWCACYTLTTLRWAFSRCPRCRHLFHSVYPSHNPLARSCRGCGLELNADRHSS